MKKITILTTALVLAASAANAESVIIDHQTAGGLLTEINSCGIEITEITEIKVIGEAVLTSADFKAFRENATLKANLKKFDISEAKLATTDKLPGGQWDGGTSFVGGMTGLEEVILPETLNSLGGAPFLDCTSLKKVIIPEGIKTYPSKCFQGCKQLTDIGFTEIPEGVTTIESGAFRECALLELGGEMPSSISKIAGHAFCDAKLVSFTKLPDNLANASFGENAFQRSSVSFTEIPTSVTSLPKQVFAGTNVSFSKIPDHITSVGAMVFQSCLKLGVVQPFTIDDRFNLWKEIPQGFFFVNTAVNRTFICRAPSAPKVNYVTGGGWDECFGKPEHCVNTTMKVLASALENYQTVAPYNKMHLVALTTAVPEPIIEMPAGYDASNVSVKFVVNDVEHEGFGDVLEGEGKFVVSFGEEAHGWLHVQEISYVAPMTYAESVDDETDDATEETDPNVLYRVSNVSENLKKTIEVPVNVTPDMKPLHVLVAMADITTGVDAVNTPDAVVTRNGDIVNLTVPGAKLYDMAGRMVLSTDSNALNLGGIPAGVYVLRAGKKAIKIVK